MKHILPKLPYLFDALEPNIDAKTMEIHYTKHHQAYIDKLNIALEKHSELRKKKVGELLLNLNLVPQDIRAAVQNHGGGHLNHSMFWEWLSPKGGKISGEIYKAINKQFESFEEFKKKFAEEAMNRFGSGWVWRTIFEGFLKISSSANQDSPLLKAETPLLGLDLWEHAYYLKYQNKRADYVNAFWNIVNWDKVNELYLKAIKGRDF